MKWNFAVINNNLPLMSWGEGVPAPLSGPGLDLLGTKSGLKTLRLILVHLQFLTTILPNILGTLRYYRSIVCCWNKAVKLNRVTSLRLELMEARNSKIYKNREQTIFFIKSAM